MLVQFSKLNYAWIAPIFLFLAYEFMGILTNLFGGIAGSRFGLEQTLKVGLLIQIFALLAISFVRVSRADQSFVVIVVNFGQK